MSNFYIPPRAYQRLIGREAEVREILTRLSSPTERIQVVAIEGIAGLGKTALAQEVAWRYAKEYDSLPAHARFDIILWATARPPSLPPPERFEHQTYTTLDDVFRAVATALEIPTLMQVSPEQRPKQCWAALQHSQRVLLVVDNLEEDGDDSISGFLRNLPANTRALVTTRFHENLPYPLRLRPLEPAAAHELVASHCAERELALTPAQLDLLVASVQGLPLAARWITAMCAQKGVETVERTLGEVQTRISDELLGLSVARIKQHSPEAFQCLLAFALFDPVTGASGAALAHCLGLDIASAGLARARLEYLNLVQPVQEPAEVTHAPPAEGLRRLDAAVHERDTSVRYAVLPITREHMQRELAQQHDWERRARERQRDYYRWIVSPLDDPAQYSSATAEIANLISVMRSLAAAGEIEQLTHFFCVAQEFLYAQASWDELIEFATYILQAAAERPGLPTATTLMALLQSPIDIYRRRGQMQMQGEPWVNSIQTLSHGMHDRLLESEIDLARRRLLCNDGTLGTTTQLIPMPTMSLDALGGHLRQADPDFVEDVKSAIRVFTAAARADKVFQAHVTLGNFHRVFGSYYRIHGNLDRMSADFNRAFRCYDQALEVLANERPRTSAWRETRSAVVRASQAMVAGRMGRFDEACDALAAARVALVDSVDRVEADTARAYYEYRRGNSDRALALRTMADAAKVKLGLRGVPVCLEDALWNGEVGSPTAR